MTVVPGASLSLRCDKRTSSICREIALYSAASICACRAKAVVDGWKIDGMRCACGPCVKVLIPVPVERPAVVITDPPGHPPPVVMSSEPTPPRGKRDDRSMVAAKKAIAEQARRRAATRAKQNPSRTGAFGLSLPESERPKEPTTNGEPGVLPVPSSTFEF